MSRIFEYNSDRVLEPRFDLSVTEAVPSDTAGSRGAAHDRNEGEPMGLTLTLFDPNALAGGPTTKRTFDQSCVSIGRAADNDWALTDPRRHLTDHHCRIERRDAGHRLIDTSGAVFLNESP